MSTKDATREQVAYLRTLPAIRERCAQVHALAQQGQLEYFSYDQHKETEVVEFCAGIIQRDFGTNYAAIPPHGRWRHLDSGRPRIEPLISSWESSPNPPDKKEICRRLVDLFLVSVLLDAGAGGAWGYIEQTDPSQRRHTRSEGLAVASFNMFICGMFSGDPNQPYRVDAKGLSKINTTTLATGFQVTDANPLVGLGGRAELLVGLGKAVIGEGGNKEDAELFFGPEGRLGNLVDFLESQSIPPIPPSSSHIIPLAALWHVLVLGLNPIWPTSRTKLGDIPLGDVWPCGVLAKAQSKFSIPGAHLVPFHKLTQWITYSLMEPIEKIMGWTWNGTEDLTGLPEYRNGGLLIDFGVLTLKPDPPEEMPKDENTGVPRVPPDHPAIIEWRAMTVIELDRIADLIRTRLNLSPSQLSLAQVLESATWKGGRVIAAIRRPKAESTAQGGSTAGGGPPIEIISDGTVF